jgi:hypothetical protein
VIGDANGCRWLRAPRSPAGVLDTRRRVRKSALSALSRPSAHGYEQRDRSTARGKFSLECAFISAVPTRSSAENISRSLSRDAIDGILALFFDGRLARTVADISLHRMLAHVPRGLGAFLQASAVGWSITIDNCRVCCRRFRPFAPTKSCSHASHARGGRMDPCKNGTALTASRIRVRPLDGTAVSRSRCCSPAVAGKAWLPPAPRVSTQQ